VRTLSTQNRLKSLISFFLSFSEHNPQQNIFNLVNLCGEFLNADACIYNRIDKDLISTVSGWKLPYSLKNNARAEGYIGYDLIKNKTENVFILKNLNRTSYYKTDPNVKKYGLKMFAGYPVKYNDKIIGALYVVYKKNVDLKPEDILILKLTANFIGIQEAYINFNEQLEKRKEFENLISDLATHFIDLSFKTDIDKEINDALGKIGRFIGADRSYIFLGYKKATIVRNTHEWCRQGIKPSRDKLQDLKVKDFEWFAQKIKNKEIVYILKRNQLPKEAEPLKKLMQTHRVLSLLCVPLVYEAEVIGFLGLDNVRRPKEYSDIDIAILKVASEIFAYAIMQRRMQKRLLFTNMKLKEFLLKDPLTGLYNCRYYEEIIENEFQRAKREGFSLSVLMLDIDYFKSINEIYGFYFGDLVLKDLAEKIKKLVRRYDIVVRYSGEEFIIVALGIDKSQAMNLAKRIKDELSKVEFGNGKEKVKIKLSLAVISYPEDPLVKSKDIIEIAEKILLEAKQRGGDTVLSLSDLYKKKDKISTRKIDVLKSDIEKIMRKTNQNLMESIYALAKTIEAKDRYTGEHVESTVYYATEIAKRLNLAESEIEYIKQAAILHDLGKVGIPEKILLKRGKLTPEEFLQIKEHPRIGVEILRSVHFLHPILPIILSHHERWDGKGYPNGLKKEEIPLGARILAVADVFQALVSDRPYRKAYSFSEAVEIIENGRASHFDPQIVDTFLEVLNNQKS